MKVVNYEEHKYKQLKYTDFFTTKRFEYEFAHLKATVNPCFLKGFDPNIILSSMSNHIEWLRKTHNYSIFSDEERGWKKDMKTYTKNGICRKLIFGEDFYSEKNKEKWIDNLNNLYLVLENVKVTSIINLNDWLTMKLCKLTDKDYKEAFNKLKYYINGHPDTFIHFYLDYLLKLFYVKIGVYSRIHIHDHDVAGGPYISVEKFIQNKSSKTNLDNTNTNLEAKPMKSKNKKRLLQQQNELLSKLKTINKVHTIQNNGNQDLPLKNYIVYYFDKEAGTNHTMTISARTLKRLFNRLKYQYKVNPAHVLWIRNEKDPSVDLYLRKKEVVNKEKKFIPTSKNIHYDKKVCIKRQLDNEKWEIKRVWKSEIGKVYSTHEWEYCAKKTYKALGKPLKQIKNVKVDLYKASSRSYEYTMEEWRKLNPLYSKLTELYSVKPENRDHSEIEKVRKSLKEVRYQIKGRRLENKEKVYWTDKYENKRYKYKNKKIKVTQKTIPLSQKEYINPPKPSSNYFEKRLHKLELAKKRNKKQSVRKYNKPIRKQNNYKYKHNVVRDSVQT